MSVVEFPPLPPDCRYELLRFHAEGGLGRVFVGFDRELGREVAVKVVRPEYARSGAAVGRFRREAEITGRLEHPAVVPVYGLLPLADGSLCYAMRFLAGRTLAAAVAEYHKRPADGRELRRLLGHFGAVCQAVGFAHSRGVLHRDLKPANVMLGGFGETWVLDWGLAKQLGEPTADSTLPPGPEPAGDETPLVGPTGTLAAPGQQTPDGFDTEHGQVFGTPSHMAPEQARGDGVGPPADVWALGAMLYEILGGRPPYPSGTTAERLAAAVECKYPPPPAGVPRPLAAVCRKAMAKEPGDRYGSAGELAADVDRWLADEPVTAEPEPLRERARRWAKRHHPLVAGGLVVLLAAVPLAVALAVSSDRARRQAEADELRVRAERDRANTNLELAERVAGQVLATMVDDPRLNQPDLIEARRAVMSGMGPLYRQLVAQKADDPGTAVAAARGFRELGRVGSSLYRFPDALADLRAAEAGFRRAAEADPALLADLGYTRLLIARGLYETGRSKEAIEVLTAARGDLERAAVSPNPPAGTARWLAQVSADLGLAYHQLGRLADADAAYRAARTAQEARLAVPAGPGTDPRTELAHTLSNHAVLLQQQRQWSAARAAFEQAVRLQDEAVRAAPGLRSPRQVAALFRANLAKLLDATGEYEAAEREGAAALRTAQELATEFPTVPGYQVDLARMQANRLLMLAQHKRPVPPLDDGPVRAVRAVRAANPEANDATAGLARVLATRGQLLDNLDRPDAARAEMTEAIDIYADLIRRYPDEPEYHRELQTVLNNLGNLHYARSEYPQAGQAFRQQADLAEQFHTRWPDDGKATVSLAAALVNVGNVLSAEQKFADTIPPYARAIDVLAPEVRSGPSDVYTRAVLRNAYWGRADSLGRLGEHARAVPDWRAMLALIPDDRPERPAHRLELANALLKSGATAEAVAEVTAAAPTDSDPIHKVKAAKIASRAGAADRAVEWLTAALADPALGPKKGKLIELLKADQAFVPLHGRPDFERLFAPREQAPPPRPAVTARPAP